MQDEEVRLGAFWNWRCLVLSCLGILSAHLKTHVKIRTYITLQKKIFPHAHNTTFTIRVLCVMWMLSWIRFWKQMSWCWFEERYKPAFWNVFWVRSGNEESSFRFQTRSKSVSECPYPNNILENVLAVVGRTSVKCVPYAWHLTAIEVRSIFRCTLQKDVLSYVLDEAIGILFADFLVEVCSISNYKRMLNWQHGILVKSAFICAFQDSIHAHAPDVIVWTCLVNSIGNTCLTPYCKIM